MLASIYIYFIYYITTILLIYLYDSVIVDCIIYYGIISIVQNISK